MSISDVHLLCVEQGNSGCCHGNEAVSAGQIDLGMVRSIRYNYVGILAGANTGKIILNNVFYNEWAYVNIETLAGGTPQH